MTKEQIEYFETKILGLAVVCESINAVIVTLDALANAHQKMLSNLNKRIEKLEHGAS